MTDLDDPLRDQIDALFQEAQQGDEATREFARDSLNHFRRECQAALEWQRTAGREAVLGGATPESVSAQAEARVGEARRRLHDRLAGLLKWARNHSSAEERA